MPPGSVNSCLGGSVKFLGGAAGGGASCPGACAVSSGAVAAKATRTASLLADRIGSPPGDHGQGGAVARTQVRLRRALDELGRHSAERCFERVDFARVVVEQGVRRQNVGSAEPELAAEDV